jgi:SAM-dependent methyltransferase
MPARIPIRYLRRFVPASVLGRIERAWQTLRWGLFDIPRPGTMNFGDLRRLSPISREFGTDRGQAIDRYYIEQFLERHAAHVKGRVLEVGEDVYTRRFGADRVTQSDILHVSDANPSATIVADLADAPQIPDETFDTIVLTQTLHLIYDAPAAIRTLFRILKPGGTLLLTVPGITPVPTRTTWGYTWYWAFTQLSVDRMIRGAFACDQVSIGVHGNVLSATAFLQGLSAEELSAEELCFSDPDYPVVITACARK